MQVIFLKTYSRIHHLEITINTTKETFQMSFFYTEIKRMVWAIKITLLKWCNAINFFKILKSDLAMQKKKWSKIDNVIELKYNFLTTIEIISLNISLSLIIEIIK